MESCSALGYLRILRDVESSHMSAEVACLILDNIRLPSTSSTSVDHSTSTVDASETRYSPWPIFEKYNPGTIRVVLSCGKYTKDLLKHFREAVLRVAPGLSSGKGLVVCDQRDVDATQLALDMLSEDSCMLSTVMVCVTNNVTKTGENASYITFLSYNGDIPLNDDQVNISKLMRCT